MSKVLYLRVSDEVHAEVESIAQKEGRSMAKQAERLLWEGLAQHGKKKPARSRMPARGAIQP